MRNLALALLLLFALPLAAGAQTARAQTAGAHTSGLDGRLDGATLDQVLRIVDVAGLRGLPTEPLVNKALEGSLKRAPGPRIVAAVAALATRLETSQAELQPSPNEAELVAGANALAVGVPPATLRRVRSIQRERSVAVPLAVLSELIARGVPIERASGMVLALLERGASSQQIMAISNSIYQDIAAGIPPDAALELRIGRGVLSTPPVRGGVTAEGVGDAGPPSPPPPPPATP